jgi:hypothetical protein
MFCPNCGKEIGDNASVCSYCGASVNAGRIQQGNAGDGSIGCLVGGLSFLFPIIGLVLFLVWQNTMPVKAKSAGKLALIGFIIGIVFYILYSLIIASLVYSY